MKGNIKELLTGRFESTAILLAEYRRATIRPCEPFVDVGR